MVGARMHVLNEYGQRTIIVRVRPHDRRRVYVTSITGGEPFVRQSGDGAYYQKWEYVSKSALFDVKSSRIGK